MSPPPLISIIIPTLNAQNVLSDCLKSIRIQKFKNYEIIIADGGSADNTLKLAKYYHCKIIRNLLKTAEAGKSAGQKIAKGKYIAFIDSDNILPTPEFLDEMLYPLIKDKKIIGSEPIAFTYRPKAGFIERYSSLLGANDPYAYFCGIYDRYSSLSQKWTGLSIETVDQNDYLLIKLYPNQIHPTIGANGTIYRRTFLSTLATDSLIFDTDLINQIKTPILFAKTNNSIIHSYCESSISKFIRKQTRRIKDYYNYKNVRPYQNWSQQNFKALLFSLYTLSILLPVFDSLKGYSHKKDIAWFFHPFACIISLVVYTNVCLKHIVGLKFQTRRENWLQ